MTLVEKGAVGEAFRARVRAEVNAAEARAREDAPKKTDMLAQVRAGRDPLDAAMEIADELAAQVYQLRQSGHEAEAEALNRELCENLLKPIWLALAERAGMGEDGKPQR